MPVSRHTSPCTVQTNAEPSGKKSWPAVNSSAFHGLSNGSRIVSMANAPRGLPTTPRVASGGHKPGPPLAKRDGGSMTAFALASATTDSAWPSGACTMNTLARRLASPGCTVSKMRSFFTAKPVPWPSAATQSVSSPAGSWATAKPPIFCSTAVAPRLVAIRPVSGLATWSNSSVRVRNSRPSAWPAHGVSSTPVSPTV